MKEYVHGGDVYRHPDVLDFSANINPLGTPEAVVQAAQESITRIARYPDAHQEKLKQALAEYENVPGEWLICGNGAAELIFALVQAVRPRRALIPAPTFAEYEQALRGVDCRVSYELLKAETGFRMGESFLERMTEENPDIIFLCNPNNPTGLLTDGELLEHIAEVCDQRGILLVVDECFLDFVDGHERLTMKRKLGSGRKLFILKAFTKIYAMAGLRLGYGISGDEALLDAMAQRMQPWNVSIPAQEAGVAALGEHAYVERAKKIVEQEKRYLMGGLRELGYHVFDSCANYIFFRGECDLHRKLMGEQVMIRDCSNYPGLTGGYYRIAVRLHQENERLLEAIRKVRK